VEFGRAGMSLNPTNNRIENQRLIYETLRDNLSSLQQWFDSYDQRAGILLASAGVLLGLLINGSRAQAGPIYLMWLALALLVLVVSVLCGAFVISSRTFEVPVVMPADARALTSPHLWLIEQASVNLANAVRRNAMRYRAKRAWYWWQMNTFVCGAVLIAAALVSGYVS
jgi:hypothetical protein